MTDKQYVQKAGGSASLNNSFAEPRPFEAPGENTGAKKDGSSLRGVTESGAVSRRPSDRETEHLNRVLLSIRNVNRLITREEEPRRLIARICELLIEQHGYLGAMIIMSDEAGKIGLYSTAGMGEKFKSLAESLDKGELPPCCAGARAREGIYHVRPPSPGLKQNDGAAREGGCYVDSPAGRCAPCPIVSFCAGNQTMCISLVYHGKVKGYLAVSVQSSQAIGKEEEELFLDVAGDAAVALDSLVQAEAVRQSEEKRAAVEAQLRQAQKMEAVGRLAGGVAHDFNNVLMTIMGYSDFLMKSLSAGDERRSDVEEIKKAADRAKALTSQLLVFSRKQKLNLQVVDLNRILRDTEKMLGRLIGEDIELLFSLDPKLCPVVADSGQMEQVIMNLAVNSRDAMPGGGKITIETRNVRMDETDSGRRGVMSAGRYAQLSFTDTGGGMDSAVQEHLFEPFFTTKVEGKGTGLGLSTVYGIVKQFNGYIFVYSEPGRGTTFRIYLPPAVTAAGSVSEAAEPAAEYLRGTETILVAEDEAPVRAVTARLLRQNGYTALEAADGGEALKICAERAKDIRLALIDTIMPKMGGVELAGQLKADYPHIRLVFTSGYTEDVVRNGTASGPGAAFIQKPMEHRALLKTIRSVLDSPPQ